LLSVFDGVNPRLRHSLSCAGFLVLERTNTFPSSIATIGRYRRSHGLFRSDPPINRIGTISYPNGQSTVFNYFGTTGDERLQEIKNLNPPSDVLSQDD